MFDVYEVEAWWLFAPWVLWVITGITLWVSGGAGKRTTKRNAEFEAGMLRANENRFKAEAEAHESSAAHREAVRKLEMAETEISALRYALKEWQEKYSPKRGKDGRFSSKKKVEKPRAKSRKVG